MLKYIYFPTGRQVWGDLAHSLSQSGAAEPVVWVGDPKLDQQAKNLVVNGIIVDFKKVHTEIARYDLDVGAQEYLIFQSITSSPVREKAIKMMDRHDPYGAYRNIDRDAFFKNFVIFSLHLIKKYSPDFLLMAESPHSPFQYVLYEVARAAGIRTFSFMSWSIAPLASIREGIEGEFLDVKSKLDPSIEQRIICHCEQFLNRFSGLETDFEPEYMKRQKKQDEVSSTVLSQFKSFYFLIREIASTVVRRPKHLERGLLDKTNLKIFEPVFKNFFIKKNIRNLRSNLEKSVTLTSIPDQDYVYFPLHYEPERTTNPDGLDFHDQIKAILALRSWLPSGIVLIVKEHYSQFTKSLQGYKGRSVEFYKIVNNIRGVQIIESNVNSRSLIEGSVLTSTITGTAALESALLGVPAVIFGNPWFKGLPGIYDFSNGIEYEVLKEQYSNSSGVLDEIRNWVLENAVRKCIFLSINPSNESYFKNFYEEFGVQKLESESLYETVMNLVITTVNRRN